MVRGTPTSSSEFAVSTLANAIASLAPQVAALVWLTPGEFGLFSFIYLVYAFGVSLNLSIISEPWHLRVLRGENEGWQAYACANAALASVLGGGALAFGLFLGLSSLAACIGAIATGASVFRAGTRYYLMQQHLVRRAIFADAGLIVLFVSALAIASVYRLDPLLGTLTAWACGAGITLAVLPPRSGAVMSPETWIRRHAVDIRRLLADSLLMDVGAIFTPVLLSPFLGVASFGIYRAVSNVTAPVRLILNPLRPVITGSNRSGLSPGGRVWWIMAGGGTLLGVMAAGALAAIDVLQLQVGVLNSLSPFLGAVALTVASNFLGHFTYIRARSRFGTRALILGRVGQTAIVTVLPIVGGLLGGLRGAIWAAAIASLFTAILWVALDIREERDWRR